MGKEWYWGRGEKESSGCMSGMLHFFDFHHLLFTSSGGVRVHQPPQQHKGVEAPRNSLELDETVASTSSMGDDLKFYDVPLGIQLVPAAEAKRKKKLSSVLEDEKRNSQAGTPRTPNVVARLMGLEVLPDLAASPSIHGQRLVETAEHYQKKQKKKPCMDECRTKTPPRRQPLQPRNCNVLPQLRMDGGSRSLPDTPRVSSARSWDADPRLSLQLNKENYSNRGMKEFAYLCEEPAERSLSPSPSPHMTKSIKKNSSRDQDENKCPRSHSYAREIVRQVKESISNRRSGGCGVENAAISTRRSRPPEKKASPYRETWTQSKPSEVKPSPSWSPPMIRFSEPPKTKLTPPDQDNTSKHPVPTRPLRPTPPLSKKAIKIDARECKKASNSNERYTERIKRSPTPPDASQQQLPRSDKKKSGPSPSLVAISSDAASHPFSPVQEQEKQVDEQRRRQEAEREPEFRYVRSILKHAGIMTTAVHKMKCYSRSLPIDPIIFHQLEFELELELPLRNEGTSVGTLRHRWNRKLLFHLVSELLGDLMPTTTHLSSKRWRSGGESVLLRLWSQIRSFPSADCRVVGDIDAVVEGDLPEAKVRGLLRHPSVAEEAEDIALEIEQNIFDSLVAEAAASLALLHCSSQWGRE